MPRHVKHLDRRGLEGGGNVRDLKIGDAAPDFSLPGIDGKTHTLADYKDAKLLMVAFLSNHCPDSHAAESRIKKLVADMKGKSFTFVAINPNNPDGLSIDELGYSKYNDGFDDMKKYAAEAGFDFPYLYDGETQAVAKAYGCLATPHVFLFDAARKLRYKGQFDDSRFADAATVKSTDARNAVEALLAGKPVPVEVTKPHGCSTKWLSKKENVATQTEKWDKTPVDVATDRCRGRRRASQERHEESPAVQRMGHVVRAVRRGVSGTGHDRAQVRPARLRAHHDQRR